MKRVAVVGSGGAGKSTFSRQLAQLTDLPVIHLDHHYWKPGWVGTPVDEWRELQSDLLAGEQWIADGNYGSSLDIRFSRADTVIVLAISRYLCTLRALRRLARNYGKSVQAEGCPERFEREFYQWIWNYPKEGRKALQSALDAHTQQINIIQLTSARQVKRFLKSQRVSDI